MTTPDQDPDHELTALETRVREAWGLYRENLSELDGIAYDEAEKAEWEHLQTELREITDERTAVRARAEAA
jgi:hypothetical protein